MFASLFRNPIRLLVVAVALGEPTGMVRIARTSSVRTRSIGAGQVNFTPGETVRE